MIALIDVAEPAVSLVMDARGRSNLEAIQENVARYCSGSRAADAPSGSKGAEASSDGPPTLLTIRKLVLEGGRLAADLTAVGGERFEAGLPPLRLSNVGGEKGATPGDLGTTVASAFMKSTVTAVARSQIEGQLDRFIEDKLTGSERQAAKEALEGLFGK